MNATQIKNMRNVLSLTLGPYAFIAPDKEIISIRDKMQAQINRDNRLSLGQVNSIVEQVEIEEKHKNPAPPAKPFNGIPI